jgi:hypothetical protein
MISGMHPLAATRNARATEHPPCCGLHAVPSTRMTANGAVCEPCRSVYARAMTAPRPIDCDLHPTMPALSALMPYLDEMWREMVVRRGLDELNTIAYPSNSPLTARADWRGGTGKPASVAHWSQPWAKKSMTGVRHRRPERAESGTAVFE